MKRFEELFAELKEKIARADPASRTVRELAEGPHGVGKKLVEEAAEAWMAARFEGKARTAEEISQVLYHAQVLMLSCGLELEDVYRYL